MELRGIDHITINLLNVESSVEFYEKVLNLKKLQDVDMGDHILHLYQLSTVKLELIEYKEPQKVIRAGNTDKGIYRHFAVLTDDMKEIEKRCKEFGCGINMEPTYISQLGVTAMLIKDPNGVEIEIIEDSL